MSTENRKRRIDTLTGTGRVVTCCLASLLIGSVVVGAERRDDNGAGESAPGEAAIMSAAMHSALALQDQPPPEQRQTPPQQPQPAPPPVDAALAAAIRFTGAEIEVEAIGSDTIIMRGNERDLETLEFLIDQLDRDYARKELQVVTLTQRNATDVAQTLERILRDMEPPALRPEDRVTVVAVGGNILLVAAPAERIEQIIAVVRQIDAVPSLIPDSEQMVFAVHHRKAAEAAAKLREIIEKLRQRQGADAGPEIQIIPNDANNTILVMAPKTERRKIQDLLDQIDVEPAVGFGVLKLVLFPLVNTDAERLAEVINEMLAAPEGVEAATEQIRRLIMLQTTPDGRTRELAPLDLEKPLRIHSDKSTNSLVVATVDENLAPIGEIIHLLDGVPLGPELSVRLFPLRFADAGTVRDMLVDMFEQGKTLPRRAPGDEKSEAVPQDPVGRALVYNVSVSADERTNVLVVSGRPYQLNLIQGIVSEIDVPATATKFPLRLIFCGENVDASRLASVIRELFDKRIEALETRNAGAGAIAREKVFLAIDIRSNALVVSASEENFREIAAITEQLNVAPDRIIDNIRLITCHQVSAADLQTKIDELWRRKAELRTAAEVPTDLPVVVADQRSNSLIIASSPEDFAEIERLVGKLEAQPLAPIAGIRLLQLKSNDATAVSEMLKSLFEERMQQRLVSGQDPNPSDRVAVVSDAPTNTILVASSLENFQEMQNIVEAIDVEPDVAGVVRSYVLQNAEARLVADRIRELFDQGIYSPSALLGGELVEARQKVALTHDPRANAVIASASKQNLSIIETLIAQMDSVETPLREDTRLFRLDLADALQLTDILQRLFEGMKSGTSEPDLFAEPVIIPDPRSNTLIISGSRDALKRSAALIAQLDGEAGPPTSRFEIYPLQHASAVKLAPKIQDMFDKRAEGTDTTRTPINVFADEGSNNLICSASHDDQKMVQGLLALLDRPSTIARQVQLFPLKKAKAETLAETLETLFQSRGEGAGGADRADALGVQADPRTNALIVWAAPTELENISQIIEKLDTAQTAVEMAVRVIRLEQALAEDFAEILNNTLIERGARGGGDEEAAMIVSYTQTLDDGTLVERKFLRQDLVITPDPRTNSLMVLAPVESMDMLETMIRDFDRVRPRTAEIRLFPLVNADAEETVEKLTDLFEEQAGAGRGEEGGEERLVFGEGGELPTGRQKLRFTADRRTNTVIAAGNTVDLNMVEQLVRRLDAQDIEERISEVYEARYATAETLTEAISSFSDAERDRLSEIEDQASAMRQAERHITVIGDEDSNSVLLGISPRYYSQYLDMIHDLDRPPPQVMIQVLIAEVSLDDRLELGLEFAAQDLHFTENAALGPNGTIQGPEEFDFVAGTDIGAGGAAGSFGGFSFSVTGEDFNFLVRALETDGKLEILSRPSIMVQNNEEANITIGNQVPFVRSSNVSDSGQTNSSVEYEDIGIILDVTPHINPDGYVNLEVHPEISSITDSSVQISEGLTAPIFSNRSAETTVTIKDGETIVIGGLITTRDEDREVKVPILGDVPGLGVLFRSTTHDKQRNELLIVLTVNVIYNETDAREISIAERDKAGLLPDTVRRNPLMEGLRILPDEEWMGPQSPQTPGAESAAPKPVERMYGPTPELYGPKTLGRPVRIGALPGDVYGPRQVQTVSFRQPLADGGSD